MPKSPRLRAVLATCACAAVLAATPTSVAFAGKLIGSADIADNSIRGRDIREGTVTGADVKDGSLTGADFGALPAGPQGPQGEPGPQGPAGTDGRDGRDGGPDATYTWTAHFTSNGSDGHAGNGAASLLVSSQTIAPHTRIDPVDLNVTGDFSTCKWSGVGAAAVRSGQELAPNFAFAQSLSDYRAPYQDDLRSYVTGDSPEKLAVFAECDNYPATPEYGPIPSFTAIFTFSTTRLDTQATTTFQ